MGRCGVPFFWLCRFIADAHEWAGECDFERLDPGLFFDPGLFLLTCAMMALRFERENISTIRFEKAFSRLRLNQRRDCNAARQATEVAQPVSIERVAVPFGLCAPK